MTLWKFPHIPVQDLTTQNDRVKLYRFPERKVIFQNLISVTALAMALVAGTAVMTGFRSLRAIQSGITPKKTLKNLTKKTLNTTENFIISTKFRKFSDVMNVKYALQNVNRLLLKSL